MRLLLTAMLFALPLPLLAARGTPPVCDPPPSTVTMCLLGKESVAYLNPQIFGAVADKSYKDLCERTPEEGAITEEWILVCEATAQSSEAHFVCVEDKEHAVSCQAGPLADKTGGFLYLWAADGVVLKGDDQTILDSSEPSFACVQPGLGTLTLSVSKPSGATSTISRDFVCTGAYSDRVQDNGSGGGETGLPFDPETPPPAN